MEWVFAKGFFTGAGLIIAIGAQNAYVLSQGLRRAYPGLIASTCSVIDAVLIVAGIMGMGALIQSSEQLLLWVTLGGALFLSAYGVSALQRMSTNTAIRRNDHSVQSARSAVMTCLALSLLNPHVYLETVVLLGSIGGALPAIQAFWFGLGAVVASFCWFFALAFGAGMLAPILRKPKAWRILDGIIAVIMFGIAAELWRRVYLLW
ncbi:MAG: LysE/ArgO family amino acid transporter [Oleiphilaceae bacterium]|nr:LysE/ArgO family amino acid transporter [Oleiphilaceae bacterium]